MPTVLAVLTPSVHWFRPVEGAPLFTQPLKTHSLEAMVKFIATKYPTAVVINTLPQDQALKLLALAA